MKIVMCATCLLIFSMNWFQLYIHIVLYKSIMISMHICVRMLTTTRHWIIIAIIIWLPFFSLLIPRLFKQVVANCLTSLQEIWSLEASTSEEAARERENLLSKPVVYYFLNRYQVQSRQYLDLLSRKQLSSVCSFLSLSLLFEPYAEYMRAYHICLDTKSFAFQVLDLSFL